MTATRTKTVARLMLGKKEVKNDPRTLKLARYLDFKALAPAPGACDWSPVVKSWPMLLNDRIGDCTIATIGHMEHCWTANALAQPFLVTEDQVLSVYEAVGHYVPGRADTDQGCVELDVLNFWRRTGIAGRRITGYAQVNPKQAHLVKQGIYRFGGLYIGLALPESAQDQVNEGLWHVLPTGITGKGQPGSWGGHAVPVVGYDAHGLTFITWGMVMKMTWNFWYAYTDEAYVCISPDWLNAKGISPSGFDLPTLMNDLQKIAG